MAISSMSEMAGIWSFRFIDARFILQIYLNH
jgi:hypothetical protein